MGRVQGAFPHLEETWFPTVARTMEVLFIRATMVDEIVTILVDILSEGDWFLYMLFLVAVFLTCLNIMNLLLAILRDVVSTVSKTEKGNMSVAFLKTGLLELMIAYDLDEDRRISPDEFSLLLDNPDVRKFLKDYGADVATVKTVTETAFRRQDDLNDLRRTAMASSDSMCLASSVEYKGDVPIEEPFLMFADFLYIVMRLRGGNDATVTDIVELMDHFKCSCQSLRLNLKRRRKTRARR